MTHDEIVLVQSSWKKVQPIAPQAAEMFYRRLFDIAPDLRGLFTGDMHAQGRRLMAMIDTAVRQLDKWDQLVPTLHALGRRHVEYGVKDADYDAVGAALLWTLQEGLGDAFTEEVRLAWVRTYTAWTQAMTEDVAAA